ncbi:MAG: acetyl-CoA C-acetyltransferase [Promethearchaeota archaeon]
MSWNEEVVIVGFVRTAFSRSRPNKPERDVFYKLRADDLAVICIKELIKQTGIDPSDVDDCITGCAFPVNENWMDGGRTISLSAGLPFRVPAMGIDRQCASSLSTVQVGAMEIMTGMTENGVVIAGGMEHMTRIPMSLLSEIPLNSAFVENSNFDSKIALNMGLTAEKLFSESNLSREDLDRFSVRSHELATKAVHDGYFKGEIIPVEVELPDGSKKIIDEDQSIRKDVSLEKTASLKPVFKPDGVITAGNSSPLNAGAAYVLLMSRERADDEGLKPMAKIKAMSVAGVDPTVMGKGPVPASRKILRRSGLSVADIDFWEINEAFAVVPLWAMNELDIDLDRVNVKGGAIAIGHPLGATGARLVGTLARILNLEGGTIGIATVCVGGGQGAAILLERC